MVSAYGNVRDMDGDFNPLDLTPGLKTESSTKADQLPATPHTKQKAVVRRVGLGPLLHSKIVKLFVLLAMMFFFAFGGYAGVEWLLSRG